MTKPKSNGHGLTIESGIPCPSRNRTNGLNGVLRSLQPGQSVMVPDGTHRKTSSAVTYVKLKNPGRRYETRQVDGGLRIWRTA